MDAMANLKQENEALRQELYVAKNKLQVANKTSAELSDELELMAAKWNEEVKTIREQHANQLKAQVTLVEQLAKELEEQRQQQLVEFQSPDAVPVPDHIAAALQLAEQKLLNAKVDWEEQEKHYQEEIERLQRKLTTSEREHSATVWKNSELKEEVEMLQDQLATKKENLQIKAQEVEELRELLASAQQQNGMLTAEVTGLRSGTNNAQKGNSLFGEVDEQRKRLMVKYTQLRTRFYQQKAEHDNCSREIQQLRMMRLETQKQYEQCIREVRSAEYHNLKALQELNKDLHEQVERLSRRVRYLESELAHNSAEWVNSLVMYNKEEMQKLRMSLITFQHKQRESMELHENAVKEAWKWRLEAQRLKMKTMNLDVPPAPADLTVEEEPTAAAAGAISATSSAENTLVESSPDESTLKPRMTPESEVENRAAETIPSPPVPHEVPTVDGTSGAGGGGGDEAAGGAMPLQEKSSNVGTHILRPKFVKMKCYKLSDLMVKRAENKPPETKPDDAAVDDGGEK